jgi:hypothetical protein
MENGSLHRFTGKDLLTHLCRAAASLGPDKLGYTPDQIGLYSVRSGVAMAMYLAGVPVFP